MKDKSIGQKLELIANILIILAAISVICVIINKYLISSSTGSTQQVRVQPKIGNKVNLPELDFSQKPRTLILVLQKGCRFCTESAPFYKRLKDSTTNQKTKLVAVLPSKIEDSIAYAREIGIPDLEIKQSALNNLQVSGTPTLILTNNNGEIINFWIGKLPPEKEEEIINQLNL